MLTQKLLAGIKNIPPFSLDGSISLAVGVAVGLSVVIIFIVVVAMILLLGWKKVICVTNTQISRVHLPS